MPKEHMTVAQLIEKLQTVKDGSTPVLMEFREDDHANASWSIDEVELSHSFVVLKSID